ncbi:hypothetical protein M6B38_259665 [Iris pallida]|uniref:Uncharacterized protein n=1 Tax=Iris pallida TaxID=29817 RepID=A0AAX6HYT1_IRIPA|nr:hypothetical protein M6B38_279135 [Iris pallida]KAJ6851567.1 hypothetical protein M6B38_259660 [Iris pallida]KAJ6851568.1 hypothetical protein M6B38_259665 [Iris pallida]
MAVATGGLPTSDQGDESDHGGDVLSMMCRALSRRELGCAWLRWRRRLRSDGSDVALPGVRRSPTS